MDNITTEEELKKEYSSLLETIKQNSIIKSIFFNRIGDIVINPTNMQYGIKNGIFELIAHIDSFPITINEGAVVEYKPLNGVDVCKIISKTFQK